MSAPAKYCMNCKCSRCAGYRRTQRLHYRKRRAEKRCPFCMKQHRGERVLCDTCAKRFNAKQLSRYHSRRAAKQCVDCGRDTGGPAKCVRCRELRKLLKSRKQSYRRKRGDRGGWYTPSRPYGRRGRPPP